MVYATDGKLGVDIGSGKGAAPFQSAIIYLGENLDNFKKVFGKYGHLYVPAE